LKPVNAVENAMIFLLLYAPKIQAFRGVHMTKESDKGTGDIVIGGITYAREMVLSIETDLGSYPEVLQGPEEQESPETPYLTDHEAAKILDISVREVRRLVHEKRLGCIQLTKRKKVFTQTLIDEFIRRESSLREHQGLPGKGAAALPEQPRTTITVEESRALLKGLTKKS
jgi:excisionase family DNA binding protein